MVPLLSLPVSLSLSLLSLSVSLSQMAILLTAAKKMLHSPVHTCPEVFLEHLTCSHAPPQAEDAFLLVGSEVALFYPQRADCVSET